MTIAQALAIPVIICAVVVVALLVGDARSAKNRADADDDFWNGI